MVRLKIIKTNEEWVDKLANVLPGDGWRTYLSDLKKIYLNLNLSLFIEKIKERELELQKISNAKVAIDEVDFKSEENVREEEEQVKEISAIKVEKKAETVKMIEKCSNCENLNSENAKLLRDLESLTLENKNLKNSENVLKNQKQNLENEKLKMEKEFQSQIKILEDEKDIFGKNNLEKQIAINSYLAKIIQLEKEAKSYRHKIADLENKLKGFVTSSAYVNISCPKPINSIPISDDVTNFDNVKVEDCDEKSDDEIEKIEKQKLFLELKEKFKNTVLQSTEIGECSKQKPVKKIVEQKQIVKKSKNVQNKNKSSSDQSSNRNQKLQKMKNENSKIVGNKWCRSDHSAQKSNPTIMKRKGYHQAKQCFDLSVWYENGDWYDNRVCYKCGFQGHIAVNCQSKSFESRRCYNCNIIGHIARDCPMRSNGRSRAVSQKRVMKSVKVKEKPKELKVSEQKVKEPKVQEKKVKRSQGPKDRLRKKRKKAREYLEKILSSDATSKTEKSSDKSSCSSKDDKSSKTNSSDANLRTEWSVKKGNVPGDEFVSSEIKEPCSGDDSDSSTSEEPQVELKSENSVPPMDDTNFPPLRAENSKQKVGKVKISNYSEKKEFNVEKAFNNKVKNIFGKMVEGKVKGVKEFYEAKRNDQTPSEIEKVTPKAGQAWVPAFVA
ncbi:putative transcription factor interactor and regulator CCHC(Zn) family [Helianthus annuus]|nr:putative transcription factor interactor and regulator CCHC(Zn) family [Helianthus annuus]